MGLNECYSFGCDARTSFSSQRLCSYQSFDHAEPFEISLGSFVKYNAGLAFFAWTIEKLIKLLVDYDSMRSNLTEKCIYSKAI